MILKYVEPLSFDQIIIDKVEKIRFGKIEAGFSCKDLKDYLNQKYEFLSNYNEDLIEVIDLVIGVVNWDMKKGRCIIVLLNLIEAIKLISYFMKPDEDQAIFVMTMAKQQIK